MLFLFFACVLSYMYVVEISNNTKVIYSLNLGVIFSTLHYIKII